MAYEEEKAQFVTMSLSLPVLFDRCHITIYYSIAARWLEHATGQACGIGL